MSKKILITGCSSGFGLDAAKTLAGKGHHVYATMRAVQGRNAPKAQELRNFAESEGLSISVRRLRDPEPARPEHRRHGARGERGSARHA